MKYVLPLLLIVAAACSTPSSVQPLSVPLKYKTMISPAEVPTVPACAAVSSVVVTDARDDKNLGKRFVEGKNTPPAPVTTTDDVAAWAKSGAEAVLNRAGVKVGGSGPALHITIEQITTSENVLHRSGYEGHISVSAELGNGCWKDHVEGSSENYGYAGSVENYQETLNHALDRTVARILNSRDFKKSVCNCS